MTIPPSPAPAPLAAPEAPSPASTEEQRAMRRQLRILSLVVVLPGLIVFAVGSLVAALPDPARADPFVYVSPLARVGWGLLALGVLLLLPLGRILARLNPRFRAQAQAYTLQRYRHPRLAASAAIWWYLVLAATFAAPALAPRELLISWLTPPNAPVDVTWDNATSSAAYGAAVFLGAFLSGVIIAIVPMLALRRFDRPC